MLHDLLSIKLSTDQKRIDSNHQNANIVEGIIHFKIVKRPGAHPRCTTKRLASTPLFLVILWKQVSVPRGPIIIMITENIIIIYILI